jgi:hypothetical protein
MSGDLFYMFAGIIHLLQDKIILSASIAVLPAGIFIVSVHSSDLYADSHSLPANKFMDKGTFAADQPACIMDGGDIRS